MAALPLRVRRLARRARSAPEKWAYAQGLLSTEKLRLPDFLGIGVQKGGTTWLHENLECHPEICLPGTEKHFPGTLKEIHYFDRMFHEPLRRYADLFEEAADRVCGDITPAYGSLPLRRIRFIRSVAPDLRLVLLLRHPVDRAWSHALMMLGKSRSLEDVSDEELVAHLKHPGALRRGDYVRILENWLSVFPREQLFVGLFEEMVDNPRKLLQGIFEHLGVSTEVDWRAFPHDRVVHKGPGTPLPPHLRRVLESMYEEPIRELRQRFDLPVEHWQVSGGET